MGSFFKNHFVKQNVRDNIIQLIIYRLAFLTVQVFKFSKITPNQISFLSFILCIISCYALNNNQLNLFLVLWYISHFLDYCDGTLARLIEQTTKSLLRFDHTLDLLRIAITFISLAIFYEDNLVWILTSSFLSIFYFYQILNLEYSNAKYKVTSSVNLPNINKSNVLFKHIYNIIFTFNGHTLFIVGFSLISQNLMVCILLYLILLCFKNILKPLIFMIKTNRS